MSNFDVAFAFTVGVEGNYSDNPQDSGNWTGGQIGVGQLKGTKYGISAAAYPDLDIKTLSLEDAKNIYLQGYWNKLQCDSLPPIFARIFFDCGVNQGPSFAVLALQKTVNTSQDGLMGPETVAATKQAITSLALGEGGLCLRFLAARLQDYTTDEGWSIDGAGWANRLAALCNNITS